MSRISVRAFLLIAVALALTAATVALNWQAPPETKRILRVAAAADLRPALHDVVAAFERSHPEIKVSVTHGPSGNLFMQLQHRAPFDVFLSADRDFPRRLIDAGLTLPDSEFQYAVGHLVLWVPNRSPLEVETLGIRAVLDPSVHKIAIANPGHAPYGRAAEAALHSLGVYDRVKDRLVLGDSIEQTAQFVHSGAAEIGLIAQSQALAPYLRDEGRYWEVPLAAYPRMEQCGVILNWAADPESATLLCRFLQEQEGREILHRYGFDLP